MKTLRQPFGSAPARSGARGKDIDLTRRHFLQSAALGAVSLALPYGGVCLGETAAPTKDVSFDTLLRSLLREWCDGMLAVQINNPANPAEHGALGCPACGFIHGRCMDAVYPLLHMARATGEGKYLKGGIAVFEWSRNVSQADGSWTVIPDPKSWRGITVFGAIALAEALRFHGDLLEPAIRQRWRTRLEQAAAFIYDKFSLTISNINYGCTAVYALNLLGHVLDQPAYIARSRELAQGVKGYLTQPNLLLFGEGHPMEKNATGQYPVDLGYNVEESLVALALYATEVKDRELTDLITRSLQSHLQFMLSDGAWDNSWGTRQFKWTYWGSRTCDGCQPGFAVLAKANPAFGTAAYQNTRLMQRCTKDGLLHGGLHYVSHGVKPCVHHTFTHAKSLAAVLDCGDLARGINPSAPLPRAQANGVKAFPEIATWLAARGPWRATVTAYDWLYKEKIYHPTGGAISLLWQRDVGPLLAGSMAEYSISAEKNNMQPQVGAVDYPLTPRIEAYEDGSWFTNLHDLEAEVAAVDEKGAINFKIRTRLLSASQAGPAAGPAKCELSYQFAEPAVTLRAKVNHPQPQALKAALVLPVISQTGEKVRRVSDKRIEIEKPEGIVIVEANVPLRIQETGRDRIFNLVPGFEAVPIVADFLPMQAFHLECHIRVRGRLAS